MKILYIIVIIAGTAALVLFSWKASIKAGRYHGIYRFFVFESIFLLVLINAGYWFKNPLSYKQLFSWFFLGVSIFLASYGFYLLYRFGKPRGQMEETTELIKVGLYKYIRHPLYLSLICVGIGALLKHVTFMTLCLALVNIISAYATARVEEKEMTVKFGDEYKDYMRVTKRFIPFVF